MKNIFRRIFYSAIAALFVWLALKCAAWSIVLMKDLGVNVVLVRDFIGIYGVSLVAAFSAWVTFYIFCETITDKILTARRIKKQEAEWVERQKVNANKIP